MSEITTYGGDSRDLQQVSQSIRTFLLNEDQESHEQMQAVLGEKKGLIRRVFPTAAEKALSQASVDRIRSSAEAREHLLTIYHGAQYQIAQRECEALVVGRGIQLRTEIADYALKGLNKINSDINRRRAEFLADYDRQRQESEQYQHDVELYEDLVASHRSQRVAYFRTCDEMLRRFTEELTVRIDPSSGR